MAIYPIFDFSSGLIDEKQQAKLSPEAGSTRAELLECNDYYINTSKSLTRRPPIQPFLTGNNIHSGEIIDVKITDKHFIFLRKVSLGWILNNLTPSHPLYQKSFIHTEIPESLISENLTLT